jgi:hypothetical protein
MCVIGKRKREREREREERVQVVVRGNYDVKSRWKSLPGMRI